MATEGRTQEEQLARNLTATGLWILTINGMIGAGIFGVPAEAARLTGVFSPLMFVFCGLIMAPVILAHGEVASYFRGTGGPILYTRAAFGPFFAFQTGWALYVARVTAFAANLNLLVSSVAYFWPAIETGGGRVALLFAICGSLTWINVAGVRHAVAAMGVLTVLKLTPLVLLVALGLGYVTPETLPLGTAEWPVRSDFGAAALLLIYAFVGWEGTLIPAGEAKNPARDMPRALLWALLVATVLYALIQAVSVAVLPDLAESQRPLVDVADALVGPVGALILTAGVVVSVGGNVAGTVITAPRVTYALARDGLLPQWLGGVHPRYLTPHQSIVFFGIIAFGLAVWGSFAWLAGMSSVVRLAVYVLSIACLPALRRKLGPPPVRLPGGLLIPAIAILVCLWLLAQVTLRPVLVTLGFLAVGMALYTLAPAARRRAPENPGRDR